MKKKAMFKVLVATALSAILPLLAGCNSRASSDNASLTITFLNTKGEIQRALERVARDYHEKTGVRIEIQSAGTGQSPFTRILTAYNAGIPPTMAMLDMTDIIALGESRAVDLTDQRWVTDGGYSVSFVNGRVFSFPFSVEGMGIIYNRTTIENVLGIPFDSSSINSRDTLEKLLSDLRAAGMENPIVISSEDWSLGAHMLLFMYASNGGTTEGINEMLEWLKGDSFNLSSHYGFNNFMDTVDMLLEYNFRKRDPLGSVYERDAIPLVDGNVALWFNGTWAWPTIAVAGASTSEEYGFMPFVIGNDTSFTLNNTIVAAPSKQIMIDRERATPEQIQAAKDFLNWLVYDEAGQQALVEELNLIPAFPNNRFQIADPLSANVMQRISEERTSVIFFDPPGDHWRIVGGEMQRYIAGRSSRAELANSITAYWQRQN